MALVENPKPAATLEEFREQMGPLAGGRSDEELARWRAKLDRFAEWLLDHATRALRETCATRPREER